MRRFLKSQRVCFLSSNVINDEDLVKLLPLRTSSQISLSKSVNSDSELLSLLTLSHAMLELTPFLYVDNGYIKLLGSSREFVFNSSDMNDLIHLYSQLNPGCTIDYVSPFYNCHGSVSIGGDILGSNWNARSAQSSGVVAAYWPTFRNDIQNFNHSRASVGKVQYYVNHSATIKDAQGTSHIVRYTLAYVHWMHSHHNSDMYGISATICSTIEKEPSLCSFVPVLRILAKCATCVTTINKFWLLVLFH